ncbi:hypothetical protein Moror_5121, partial [Moniliophthora roreri MCA 2997]
MPRSCPSAVERSKDGMSCASFQNSDIHRIKSQILRIRKRYLPMEENVDQRLRYLKPGIQPLFSCYLPPEAVGRTIEASFDTVYTYSEGIPRVIVKYPIKKNTWTSSSHALKDGVVVLEDGLT